MTYIRRDDYTPERERPKILSNYLEKMVLYLKTQNPNRPIEEIESFVKKIIRERMKSPNVEAVHHKTEGNSEVVTMPLTKYVTDIIKDNNLSPSGTCYFRVSVKESFLRISLSDKISDRNKFKKLYLTNEAEGKKRESQYYNQMQANAKIFNNAIAGGMKITQFILGCKAGFNAITSIGRMSVKQGYSFVERFVTGNIYIPSTDAAITYVLNHTKSINNEFEETLKSFNLYIPTVEDVTEYLIKNVKNYVTRPKVEKLTSVLEHLSDTERAYIFYVGCFKNLCEKNESLLRPWIDSCFSPEHIDSQLYKDIDISEIGQFKGDVITCVLSTNYKKLGMHPEKKGKWNSTKDAAKHNPEGLKEFIYACRHFTTHFEKLVPLLRSIFQIETTFSKLVYQHRMARHCVPLSDTDSNIFSTQELVRWKRGKLDFSQESYEMNAIVVFLITQSLEHVFARLSAGFGAEGQDVFKISMKNEFLYPILFSTSLAKHYLAIATMQEGSLLPDPRRDIKGVGFRSSTYPRIIRDRFENYVVDLMRVIQESENIQIKAASVLKYVADMEREIYTSVKSRDSTFLQTITIKREEEYADPAISQYFYYEMWKEVFEDDFGEMVIPNKCYKIPLIKGKRFFKDPAIAAMLQEKYPKIHEKMTKFIEKFPDRDITSILIPPFKGEAHQFFLDVMDVRDHVSQVMRPYYLLLSGFGIGTVDDRTDSLVSDFYDPSLPLLV